METNAKHHRTKASSPSTAEKKETGNLVGLGREWVEGQDSIWLKTRWVWGTRSVVIASAVKLPPEKHTTTNTRHVCAGVKALFPRAGFYQALSEGQSQVYELMLTRMRGIWATCSCISTYSDAYSCWGWTTYVCYKNKPICNTLQERRLQVFRSSSLPWIFYQCQSR